MQNITVIQFLKIEKSIAQMNMKNKDVLEQNALDMKIFVINAYISDTSYATISNIVRKIMRVKKHETLLKKFIQKAPMCVAEQIEVIDNILIEVEKEITEEMNMSDVMEKLTNNKNFNPSLN
jgi:hypothetical protein